MNRLEKALVLRNLQLDLVISDLAGQTGLRILRAIVSGERDPRILGSPPGRSMQGVGGQITGPSRVIIGPSIASF